MTENLFKKNHCQSVDDNAKEDPLVFIKDDAVEGNGQSDAIVKDGALAYDRSRNLLNQWQFTTKIKKKDECIYRT